MNRIPRVSAIFLLILAALPSLARSQERAPVDLQSDSARRHPVAIAAAGDRLFIANRDRGSVSVVSKNTLAVEGEYRVGVRLSDIVTVPHSATLLATDRQANQLLLVSTAQPGRVLQRLKTPMTPVNVVVSGDGAWCSVACLWSRRVSLVDIQQRQLKPRAVVDLPFAPRLQWLAPDQKTLVVAAAFSGDLAIIDVAKAKIISRRSLDNHNVHSHNIRGMGLNHTGDRLLISHQMLHSRVPTLRERVFWGAVVSNVIKSVELKELLTVAPDPDTAAADKPPVEVAHWELHPTGEPGRAGGDPGAVLETPAGETIVLLSGVNEVGIRRRNELDFQRLEVGAGPVAMSLNADRRRLYVVSRFDDTLHVVDVASRQVTHRIALGQAPPLTEAARGEQLFFDARLSLDGWFSCHSCHIDGHTSDANNDNMGDDSIGAPKRIPTLLGVGDSAPWAWNGKQKSLRQQVHKSIKLTMIGDEKRTIKDADVAAISAFIKTLAPPPSLAAAREPTDPEAVAAGKKVFAAAGCNKCHAAPAFTTSQTYDVGLQDENGQSRFNPPGLRGVSQRQRFFHDGRATSLPDLLKAHDHPGTAGLTASQRTALLAYLRSL